MTDTDDVLRRLYCDAQLGRWAGLLRIGHRHTTERCNRPYTRFVERIRRDLYRMLDSRRIAITDGADAPPSHENIVLRPFFALARRASQMACRLHSRPACRA